MARPIQPAHAKGAFIYLARHKNLDVLVVSLLRLHYYYLKEFPSTVLIFHDDLTAEDQDRLRRVPGIGKLIELHKVSPRAATSVPTFLLTPFLHASFGVQISFCLPSFLTADVPKYVGDSPVNYRHMMRFFAVMLFTHPALWTRRFTHYARMDTDSFLVAPIRRDIFRTAAQHEMEYGFVMLWRDSERFIGPAWEQVKRFEEETRFQPKGGEFLRLITNDGSYYRGDQFWNNFELVTLRFVQSREYMELLLRFDASELMYTWRLGDAPIRTIAVAELLPESRVRWLRTLPYQHQSQFSCPLDQEQGGQDEVLPLGDYNATSMTVEWTPRTARDDAFVAPGGRAQFSCDLNDKLTWIGDRCNSRKLDLQGKWYCGLRR